MARRRPPVPAALVVLVLAVAELAAGMVAVARQGDDGAGDVSAASSGGTEAASGSVMSASTAVTTGDTVPASPLSTGPAPAGVEGALASALGRNAASPRTTMTTATTAPGGPGTTAGPSGPAVLRAPFADAYRATECAGGPMDRCVATSNPEASSGAVGLVLELASPGGATVPGAGTAQAYSEVLVLHQLSGPVRSLLVTVEFRIRSAGVGRSVAGVLLPPLPTSTAQVFVEAAALHGICGGAGCFIQEAQSLVDLASGPQGRKEERVTLRLRLASPEGDLPAGQVSVSAGIYGVAELGSRLADEVVPDVGAVNAKVDALVTSITVTPAR